MYFEFGQGLQAGLDCAGDVTPDQGAVFGWVRHPVDEALGLRVEAGPGEPVECLLLDLHPRPDVPAGEGMTVSGFSLIHAIPPGVAGRVLVIALTGADATAEAPIDLKAYDLPSDVAGVTQNRQWGATFRLFHASAADPARIRTLTGEGTSAGIFGVWLDRLPRLASASEWFMDFRRVSARIMPDGQIAISGGFNLPPAPGEEGLIAACALVRARDGRFRVQAIAEARHARLEGGFVLSGRVEAADAAAVEAVIEVRRGAQRWWFRAEAERGGLADYLDSLTIAGFDLAGADAAVLHDWVRRALADRGAGLRGRMDGLGLSGIQAPPGGTALLFDVNDEYAARLLSLLASQLEARFGSIVLSGSAASKAAAALMRRGRMEVSVESDAESALLAAGRRSAAQGGAVSPIDTAALVDAAVAGDPSGFAANAIPAGRVPMIVALHGMAGVGDMESTLRRLVALMAGADPAALPMPAGRGDAIGGLVTEHLRGLWEMVPVTGAGR